ncbi:MAG: phospholipase D-like domain-containing protein [Ruegeria sp.]
MFEALRILKKNAAEFSIGTFALMGAVFMGLVSCSGAGTTSPSVSRAFLENQAVSVSRARPNAVLDTYMSSAHVTPYRDGLAALSVRLDALDQAQNTLDISLFILREDEAGHLFVSKVLNAADRGVRVRLLLDDLFNRRTANSFFVLDNHPNIEIRIFNPYPRLSPTTVSFLLNYEKSRRRMHSRFQITDGVHAIIGGRNVGDEYFTHNGSSHFLDFEIGIQGDSVQAFSDAFEIYWNDNWAVPVDRLQLLPNIIGLDGLRIAADQRAAKSLQGKYYGLAKSIALGRQNSEGLSAQVSFVTDAPDKLRGQDIGGPFLVSQSHYNEIARARKKVLIVTPYFIPTDKGAGLLERLSVNGVQVIVVTNSLASTNHVSVHGGYVDYRTRLLKAGVSIFELKPHSNGTADQTGTIRTLHSKYTIIDGSSTVVTTMNFDPISLTGNLESSVIVRSRAFARKVLRPTNTMIKYECYRLGLNSNDDLIWYEETGQKTKVFSDEPGASLGRNFISDLVAAMNIEGML